MTIFLPFLLIGSIFVVNTVAQGSLKGTATPHTKLGASLIDEWGIVGSEDRSARFDNLFIQLSSNPTSKAYVFLYCGKKCRYGEIEAHIRGIEIKIGLRKFERSRLSIVNAGYRESFSIELWLVPEGSGMPEPTPTLNIRYVTFIRSKVPLYEFYDCCDSYDDFWRNLKPE